MTCPGCGTPYQAGDLFCGNCGTKLQGLAPGGSAAGTATVVTAPPEPSVAWAPSPTASAGGLTAPCPVCGAALEAGAARCRVCGFEPGSSVVMASNAALAQREAEQAAEPVAPPPPAPVAPPAAGPASARVCPIHGPLDPTWTRCPYCLKEGREGRLLSGAVSRDAVVPEETPPPVQPISAAPSVPPFVAPVAVEAAAAPVSPPPQPPPAPVPPAEPPPPRVEIAAETSTPVPGAVQPVPEAAQPVPSVTVEPPAPPAPAPAAPVPPTPAPAASAPAAGAPAPPGWGDPSLPPSSVGATFVIRRRPRVLAYLVEKSGESVGRVSQLEDGVTDVGRDPRNHIVLSDVMVSGFHLRVEREPDGSFSAVDRGSTNGSMLNEEPLTETRTIVENDELRVGNTTLVLKVVQA